MLLFLIYIVFFLIFIKLYNIKNYISPVFIFISFQIILFIGSIQYIDINLKPDRISVIISFAVLIFIVIGSFILKSIVKKSLVTKENNIDEKEMFIENGKFFNLILYILLGFSTIISFIYFQAIGYNLFLEQVISSNGVNDVATKRLNAYSGNSYFAPGYVNLFKNTLLPLIVGFIGLRYYFLKNKKDLFTFILFLPLSLIFILGTGQRGAFVIASLMILLFITLSVNKKVMKKMIFVIAAFVLSIFSFATFFLDRGNEKNLFGAIEGLFFRIFDANQETAVIGFRYIYTTKEIQYGQEWLMMFAGLLPGIRIDVSIANEIFEILYGSTRGTAPLSNWGSFYYNFGLIGCCVGALFIGFSLEYLYFRYKNKQKSLFRNLYYAALFIILGSWIAGDPTTLFNTGLPMIIITILLHKFLYRPK